MAKMKDSELRALLAAEKADALAAVQSSRLSQERQDAMNYYNGDVSKDLPSLDGRSKVVSTDVADVVEGLMPSLMEIFCAGDEVVRFEPVGPEDETRAEQETDYVNHVFMQQNPGFMVLYSFIKDALLQKVGVCKVWWEEEEREERETYYDQPDDAFALLVANPEVEVVEHTAKPDPYAPAPADGDDEEAEAPQLHDVTVVTRKTYACAKVEPVPPEEFGIARRARSIRDADYCFHEVIKTETDLIEQGYDAHQISALPSYSSLENSETQARNTVDEQDGGGDEGANRATRPIKVTEHYIRMDYEGDGKARLYRVTTAGEGDILKREGRPDIEPEDMIRFAAMTPVIVTHRFFGRSIADLVMDIQRIKTSMLRALMDNAYVVNNPRPVISEEDCTTDTIDDLLVSRHGAQIRVKRNAPAAVVWQTVPSIANHIYPLLEYQDATREWRTGVTRQGQGIDANALQNQSATAVNQAFTAAQARMKLIARIFAETGIRDLFSLLHATIRKHGQKAQTVRLRNKWVQVDPREWKSRNDMTINVGLGTGGRQQQLANVMALIGLQTEALANGLVNLVKVDNLYNSAKEFIKIVGLKSVEQFFTDPATQPPLQPKPDPKLIELQAKNEIEKTQAAADIETQKFKVQSEVAVAERKAEMEMLMMREKHAMEREKHQMGMATTMAKAATQPRPAANGGGEGAEGEAQPMQPDQSAFLVPLIHELTGALKSMNAPKRVVRDAQGKVSHVETVTNG